MSTRSGACVWWSNARDRADREGLPRKGRNLSKLHWFLLLPSGGREVGRVPLDDAAAVAASTSGISCGPFAGGSGRGNRGSCGFSLEGSVKFSGRVADLGDEKRHAELPWISIPARDHQPRRMAVPSILCELSRCRRSPGPTRHHGVLRSDPALVHPVRLGIRSQAQASTGPAGRHMVPGRGLRHHPGTAALSLACRRSRWRRHRHPRPVASRPPGCQTLYPQAVEGSGE